MSSTQTVTAQYPFDPTGTAATNLIQNEQQVLNPPATNGSWADYFFILPLATPFFANSLQMTLQPAGKPLVEGVDYICTHRFYDATVQCASPVYGSISFMDKTLSGIVRMQYQTLGGDWTLNSTQIAQVLANVALDPRTTTWEEVVNLPYQFPPIAHQWDLVDMTGASDVVAAINAIVTALQNSGDQGLAKHLADYNNPHHVTAVQVGLGNVSNFGMALNADAQAGSSTALYMSPSTTVAAISYWALAPLNAHIASQANPHNVTATQVGLGNVNNYGWASTSDAQAGIATNGYMNAALTSAAITAQAVTPLNAHTNNLSNPHQVNATQVGLGDVPNYPMASLNEALAGTATDRFMSPALVAAVMQGNLGGSLQAHVTNYNNPHQVTATQVGLGSVGNYGMATNADGVAGTSTILYMNPATTMAAIQNEISPFTAHLSNMSNPHNVTATQVGLGNVGNYSMAANADAVAGTSTVLYMNPATTLAAIQNQTAPFTTHMSNVNNPHSVTAAQVGLGNVINVGWASTADAQGGTVTTGYMNPALTAAAITSQVGNTLSTHLANYNNPHQVTAAQVGAYTTSQSDTNLSNGLAGKLDITGIAANSSLLQGKTVNDIVTLAQSNFTGRINYYLPSYTVASPPAGSSLWSQLCAYTPPATPVTTNPLLEMVLEITGGEPIGDANEPPNMMLRVNFRPATPTIEIIQRSGTPQTVTFALTKDPTSGIFGLWMVANPSRAGASIVVMCDPGANWTGSTNDSITAPANVLAITPSYIQANSFQEFAEPDGGSVVMAQSFYATEVKSKYADRSSNLQVVTQPVQFLNVVANSTDETSAKAIAMPFKTEYRSMGRLSSYSKEPVAASTRDVWSWDNTNSLIQCNDVSGAYLDTLLSSEPWLPGVPMGMEIEFGSSDLNDQAIGVCIGHFLLDGKNVGIWAMRTPGGTVMQSQAKTLPGGDIYKLFTVGINLFQDDAVILGATSSGLTWGDGVTDANRSSTPYVPQATTSGTNGWQSKGKVRIRVTYDGTNTLTVETTDFGSTTYVAAATQTFTIAGAAAGTPEATVGAIATWGGAKWGLSAFDQPASEFNIINAPDTLARYYMSAPQADGTDTSYLGYYCGNPTAGPSSNGWLQESYKNNVLIPGRLVYSEMTEEFYLTRRDCTLTPLPIVGSSLSGRQILTT